MGERRTSIGCAVLVWVLVVATPAEAYLDPSTGSMVISVLVGLLASLGLVLKSSWYRVRGFIGRAARRAPDGTPPSGSPIDGDVGARR